MTATFRPTASSLGLRPVRFRCPDAPSAFGGVELLFRHVEILRTSGLDARVSSESIAGLSRWRTLGPEMVSGSTPEDAVTVISETDVAGLVAPGRKVVLAQSFAFETSTGKGSAWRDAGVEAVIAVSRPLAAAVREHFGIEATVIPPSVDVDLFRPLDKRPQVAYMARKEPKAVARVLERACIEDFEVIAIEGLAPAEVARGVGQAAIALSASRSEGFGLFPLEAMASGCLVAAYAAKGGLDYMEDGRNALVAPDGDEEALTERLTAAIALARSEERHSFVACARETALRYSPTREREAVLRFWTSFLGRTA